MSKSHIDLNVWNKGGKLLDWFEILRIDRLAHEPMAFTQERMHDSSKIFVEHALLAARIQFQTAMRSVQRP